METNDGAVPAPAEVEAQLAEAERLKTLAWTEAEDIPLWMYPVAGAWFSAVMVALRLMWDNSWWILLLIALLALEGAFIGWVTKMRKANPRLRTMPPEFRKAVIGYVIGLAVVVATTMVLIDRSTLGGFIFGAVASTVGFLVYRTHWYRAVDATRSRVAAS